MSYTSTVFVSQNFNEWKCVYLFVYQEAFEVFYINEDGVYINVNDKTMQTTFYEIKMYRLQEQGNWDKRKGKCFTGMELLSEREDFFIF